MKQPQARPRQASGSPQEEASPQVSARLQDPLLDGALRFFALVAQEETIVHAAAVLGVREQIQDFLPAQTAARLAEFFGHLLLIPQIPEEVCAALQAEFTYADRIYLLLKALEFRRSVARREMPTASSERLPRQLGIREPDFRLLSAIDGGWEAAISAAVAGSTVHILPVTDVARAAALWLPVSGIRALFLVVDRNFYVSRRSHHPLQVAKRVVPENVFTRIREDETVVLGGKRVTVPDLRYYFRQVLRPRQQHRLYIQVAPEATIIGQGASPTANLCLTLKEAAPLVDVIDPPRTGAVELEGQGVTESVPGWLGDELRCCGRRLQIRKLLAYAQRDHFVFTEGETVCTISNDPQASIYIQDSAAQRWTIQMEMLAGEVRLLTGTCPHTIQVGGKRVSGHARVQAGDTVQVADTCLRIGPTDAGACEVSARGERFSTVSIEGITHRFADGTTALDHLTFELQRGDLVCVLGPSGCGKSTLLNVLNGIIQPLTGDVRLDGVSLSAQPSLQRRIGFVPQDDLLQENLTVRENLLFAAQLRRPQETAADHALLVDTALEEIDLREHQHARVGNALDKSLSGGQRKRVNIGLELVGPGSFLLLDEPTSGLSSGDTRKIVDVLRRRTEGGHLVFAVLHQPSARVLAAFDKVLVLDKGGRMAFYGSVPGCYRFFAETLPATAGVPASPEPDIVFEALEQPRLRLDGSPDQERRYPPGYWQGRYRAAARQYQPAPLRENVQPPTLHPSAAAKASFLRSAAVLLRREYLNRLRGRVSLLLQFASAAFLGIAAAFACRVQVGGQYSYSKNEALINYMFLTVIVCLFLAVSGSVQEIIRDRAILLRERMLSISFGAYLQSKFIVLFSVYACQLTLYLTVGFWVLQIPELFGAWWLFLAVVGCAGLGLGLALSAIPRLSERAAAVLVPLVIIPQIILSGADPFPFSNMGHLRLGISRHAAPSPDGAPEQPPEIAQIMPSRWAFEGLVAMHRDYGLARVYDPVVGLDGAEAVALRSMPCAGLRQTNPVEYARKFTGFIGKYESTCGHPWMPQRLGLFELRQAVNLPPLRDQAASKFEASDAVRNRTARARRLPGLSRPVDAAWFDAGGLLLFTAGFLGLAALLQCRLPTQRPKRRPTPKLAGKNASRAD